jgi:hypothetical protein
MKRISFAAVMAAVVLFGLSLTKPAAAAPQFGYPSPYGLWNDLNVLGTAATCFVPENRTGGNIVVNVLGTFVGSLDVYSSVDGKFDDSVKQGALITAPLAAPLVINLPAGATAARIQNRAYTSGDPYASIDCMGGKVVFPAVVPTPTATP